MINSIKLMGLELKNPILTAAGPWAENAAGVQRCIDAGAAAVITETISLEARPRISPRLHTEDNKLFNTMIYSNMHLEEWEDEIRKIDRKDAKLICSIWGETASEIAYIAKKVEKMEADAIELSISAPIGSRHRFLTESAQDIYTYAKAAVDAVDIPVMVKLSYEAASSTDFLRDLEKAGVKAVSAIDSLKGLSGVDIENFRTMMPTYGGYTGESIRPISLATTAALQQYTSLQVVSSGGVMSHETVLEFIMLGAIAVQLASVIQCNGYSVITDILTSLDAWLDERNIMSVNDVRRSALPSLKVYEDIVPENLCATIKETCSREDCLLCSSSCLPDAVFLNENNIIEVNEEYCDGCGLCVSRCPHQLLDLRWC